MIKKLLPLIFILVGGGAGVAAGLVLKPAPEAAEVAEEGGAEATEEKAEKTEAKEEASTKEDEGEVDPLSFEYAELSNQFLVPIVRDEAVEAVVVMSITLEVKDGMTDQVLLVEPRLRDSFLRVLFDHAAIGGFDGAFVNNVNLKRLRFALKEKAYATLGDRVNDVLITEIVRQDM